eukprot:TRINITY_DN1322_c0_g1_i1.p1 TRINITY_DN1322_c0_g1~~TRINITY_DN1322_c0_g1_i1.p1  ORF type:complete len:302 (-),score=97.47 TRINITY_DN1322_c0_g1_i1:160-1065(-)
MPIRRPNSTSSDYSATREVSVEQLFNWGRVKKDAPLLHKVLFLAYLPFGVILLVARALLFMIMSLLIVVLPRSIGDYINPFLLRLITGLIVIHNHKTERLTPSPYVLACNHVSDFDTFALWLATPRWSCVTSAHLKSVPIIGSVYSALDAIFVAPTPESREAVKQEIKQKLQKNAAPVLIFPEGGLTSGKTGTMLYQRFVFSLDNCEIVPAAIRLRDPWPVEHDYLGSSWGKNFFWFLLVPFHVFEITFLPAESRRSDETPEAFAFRVQTITSEYLGQVATKHAYADKKELVRKLKEKKTA